MREVLQYLDNDIPLQELAPTHLSVGMLPWMQSKGSNASAMPYPQLTTTSIGTISGLSGGR
jgi:hypothetical protein